MTIKLGIILLGSLLIYAGWTNRDVRSLLFGDNTVAKGGSSWAPSSAGASATGTGSSAGAAASPSSGTAASAASTGANSANKAGGQQ